MGQVAGMKILLVSAYQPGDYSFGAAQRTTLLRDALAHHGEVSTLILRESEVLSCQAAPRPDIIANISYPARGLFQKYGNVAEIVPLLHQHLDLNAYDLVVGRYLAPLLALPAFRGRAVVDADDAYYRYPPSSPGITARWVAQAKTVARTTISRRALRRCADHTWFCCERDHTLFGLPTASVLPNVAPIHTPPPEAPVPTEAPVLLLVGALWYRPNRDALEWFITHCWPRIRKRYPQARLRAVGAAPPALREQWAHHTGVECPGFVPDLAAEYRAATLTIAPITSGGGTQIKVLESLAHDRVPVVSSFVAGGFAPLLRGGESLIVADSADDTVRAALHVMDDPSATHAIARHGQACVAEFFSVAHFNSVVADTVAALAGRHA